MIASRQTVLWLLLAAAPAAPLQAAAQSCTAAATTTNFGSYNPQSASALDANGTITLSCVAHPVALVLGYTIALSTGGAGNYSPRRMSAGANTLNYQLYTDLLRTTPWGDGSGGSSAVSGGLTLSLLNAVSVPHTAYGRVPAAQTSAVAGSYSDLITVTVTY